MINSNTHNFADDKEMKRDPKDTQWCDYYLFSKPDGTFRVEEEAIDKGLYKKHAVYITDKDGWFHEVSEKQFIAVLNELDKSD